MYSVQINPYFFPKKGDDFKRIIWNVCMGILRIYSFQQGEYIFKILKIKSVSKMYLLKQISQIFKNVEIM